MAGSLEFPEGLKGCGFNVPSLPFIRICTFFSASSNFWLQKRESRMPSSKSFKDSSRGISPSYSLETIFSNLFMASSNLSFGILLPFNYIYKKVFYILKGITVKAFRSFRHHRARFPHKASPPPYPLLSPEPHPLKSAWKGAFW